MAKKRGILRAILVLMMMLFLVVSPAVDGVYCSSNSDCSAGYCCGKIGAAAPNNECWLRKENLPFLNGYLSCLGSLGDVCNGDAQCNSNLKCSSYRCVDRICDQETDSGNNIWTYGTLHYWTSTPTYSEGTNWDVCGYDGDPNHLFEVYCLSNGDVTGSIVACSNACKGGRCCSSSCSYGYNDDCSCKACVPSCSGKTCGSSDGCSGTCGCGSGCSCQSGQTCYSNACCTPSTCSSLGKTCGSWSNGCGGTLSCGTCSSGYTCNANGQCVSSCTPSTCSSLGKTCGSWSDGCSGTLSCGTCTSGYTCSNGVCVSSSCTPSCTGKTCGDNGCGGSCGTCQSGYLCNANGQCLFTLLTFPKKFTNEFITGTADPTGYTTGIYNGLYSWIYLKDQATGTYDGNKPFMNICYQTNCKSKVTVSQYQTMWPNKLPVGKYTAYLFLWENGQTMQRSADFEVCAPSCTCKECGDNGCGGTCTACPTGKTCDPSTFKCIDSTKKAVNEACTDSIQCASNNCISGKCAECSSDFYCNAISGCTNPKTKCNIATGSCVECNSHADCTLPGKTICAGNVCIDTAQCSDGIKQAFETDTDCGGPCPACGNGNICTSSTDCQSGHCIGLYEPYFCVECTDDAHCTGGNVCRNNVCTAPLCSPGQFELDGSCVECLDNSHCTAPDKPYCSESNTCAACTENAHCPGATSVCSNNECVAVECSTNADCPTGNTCSNNVCIVCASDEDCTDGKKCYNNEQCVECYDNTHCTDGKTCYNNECVVRCSLDEECQAGQYCMNGICEAPEGRITPPGGDEPAGSPCTSNAECQSSSCSEFNIKGGLSCANSACRCESREACGTFKTCGGGEFCSFDSTCRAKRNAGNDCNADYECLAGNCDRDKGECG